MLEDTRRGKKLFEDSGPEMLSAHLSRFAYATIEEGATLVTDALRRANAAGFPALFTAVATTHAEELVSLLRLPETVRAAAAVYGCNFKQRAPWSVDTSEI